MSLKNDAGQYSKLHLSYRELLARPKNPLNAILNYLYTLLESETRFAITVLGLDPGFGFLHVDHAMRDSLVYDLMEPVRPKIDAYVLDRITRTTLRRSWFFGRRDGTCRLMASFALQLAETTSTWGPRCRSVRGVVRSRALFNHIKRQSIARTGDATNPTQALRRSRFERAVI